MSRGLVMILAVFSLPVSCANGWRAQQLWVRCHDEDIRIAGCTPTVENIHWLSTIAFMLLFCWSLNKLISQGNKR